MHGAQQLEISNQLQVHYMFTILLVNIRFIALSKLGCMWLVSCFEHLKIPGICVEQFYGSILLLAEMLSISWNADIDL